MNKLDKQFGEMMKGIRIDAPSSDFTVKVMSRIQAEAAVQQRHLLQDYQPVISKKTWIILFIAFVLLMVYITVSGTEPASGTGTGFWSAISGSVDKLRMEEVSSIWQKGMGIFSSVPSIAYLILTASLALWTLDSFLARFKHQASELHVN
ncbi:MAG TPA: hypothetical protein DCR40_06650 [Prolixibacteraceae bacterium]|nr:hypothetical protein [Prolixibacteraceae bacterium]